MNQIIKKSIAREGILFLVLLTGVVFWVSGNNYIANAIAQQENKAFAVGSILVSIPTVNTGLDSLSVNNNALMRACLFQKIGVFLLSFYLLYIVLRGLFWVSKKMKFKHLHKRLTEGGRHMNRWVKNNWFQLGLLVAFFIMSFSVAYYFILFLPRQQQSAAFATKSIQSIQDQENQCFEASKKFFQENGFDEKNSTFVNHYNKKLNKCFITVKSAKMSDDGHLNFYKALYDVYERKMYGDYSWKPEENKNYWEVKPSKCSVLDKPCQTTEEYDGLVRQYVGE